MKNQFAKISALSLIGACVHASVNAQTNNPQFSEDIETITVAGIASPIPRPKIAGSVSTISQGQISASGAINISDLLRTVAGVNIGQTGPTGSLTEVRFRGAESNHIMVLVDGVAINDIGQGSLVDFAHISMANVEHIEILRGPQSALWGSNAIGGVINIITKGNSHSKNANASLGLGDRGTFQASANASQSINKLSFNVNANTYKTQGENISREGSEKDAYANTSISAGLRYLFDQNNHISINSNLVNYSADADAYNFLTGFVSDANDQAKGKQVSTGLNWHFSFEDADKKVAKYTHLLSVQYSKQDTDNFADEIFSRSSRGEKLRMLWSNRIQFSTDSFLNLGFESTEEKFSQRGATPDAASNQDQSNRSNSLVASGIYAALQNLDVNYSFRRDNNSDFNKASAYRLGLAYSLSRNTKLFISQGRAIKNPTFVERFGFFPGSFQGNPDLQPEQQDSVEAGIEVSNQHLSYQVSVFKAKLEDEVLGFVFDSESGQFTAENAQTESERQGAELSVQGEIDALSWQAQYSYLDASEDEQAELRRAKHSGSMNATYTFNPKHQLYVQADYNGSKSDRFFPPFPEPSQVIGLRAYWLLSANYVYQINTQLRANLRVSNALNHEYEDVIAYNTDGSRALLQLQYAFE